jgi:hypothetical protein
MPKPTTSVTASPWSVSGDEAAELMRLHREQLLAYDDVSTEEPEEGEKAEAPPPKLNPADVDEDLRELVARYQDSRPGVKLTPVRYITIGAPDGTTVVGSAELPDTGLVSLVITQTIVDTERADVTSRILVAKAAKSRKRAS